MDLRKMFLAGLAIATLAGCSDDDKVGGQDGVGFKTVSINVDNSMQTKAPSMKISDTKVTFNEGHIYFVNKVGQITDYYEISETVATNMDNKVVHIDDIVESDQALTFSVPEISEKIYVFGNVKGAGNLPVNGNISNITGILSEIDTQASATGDVSEVYLYGDGDIVNNPGVTGNDFAAYVPVAPIAARIELEKLTGGGAIESYEVDGIFINYFYAEGALNGKANEEELQMFNSVDHFEQNGESTAPFYDSNRLGILYDWDANGIAMFGGNPLVGTPKGVAEVWSYNLFVGEEIPHIIIKLKNVVANDSNGDPVLDPGIFYYITVVNYKDKETGKRLEAFKGGHIYRIGNLSFDEELLTELPELKEPIDVDVTIEVMDWIIKDVEADFD